MNGFLKKTDIFECQDDTARAVTDQITITQAVDLDDIETKADAAETHSTETTNPHIVTKAQVGLGSVDNTADLDKPVSTATQTALTGVQRIPYTPLMKPRVLDLTSTDPDLEGFQGAVTDGRYMYCVPCTNGVHHGKIARVDLTDFSTVSVLDLTLTDPDLKGYHGAVTDGRYMYCVPYNNGVHHGKIARVQMLFGGTF